MRVSVRIALGWFVKALKVLLDKDLDGSIPGPFDSHLTGFGPHDRDCARQYYANGVVFVVDRDISRIGRTRYRVAERAARRKSNFAVDTRLGLQASHFFLRQPKTQPVLLNPEFHCVFSNAVVVTLIPLDTIVEQARTGDSSHDRIPLIPTHMAGQNKSSFFAAIPRISARACRPLDIVS
jgi:hypothetical protein